MYTVSFPSVLAVVPDVCTYISHSNSVEKIILAIMASLSTQEELCYSKMNSLLKLCFGNKLYLNYWTLREGEESFLMQQ